MSTTLLVLIVKGPVKFPIGTETLDSQRTDIVNDRGIRTCSGRKLVSNETYVYPPDLSPYSNLRCVLI